ncbi:hypothetical protein AAE478_004149 [Parahypoxylon ruwenzoriense]
MFKRRAAPDRVPTDTVVPLNILDGSLINRTFVMNSLYVFDDVLDPEKLRGSLERLAHREGYRKLGARLRKSNQGGFEHHIPAEFNEERPAIGYTHVVHDMISEEHPMASRLPKPKEGPAVVSDPAELTDIFRGPDCPTKMDDYLYTDRPQLSLHVVSFKDKTVIVLYWPHSIFDAMGMGVMFDAWILMLQGREDEIRPPHGFDHDALSELGRNATEPHKLAGQLMTTPQLVLYGFKNVADLAWRSKENRMACIPGEFLEKMRAKALAELAMDAEAEGKEKPWVSEGDVLAAWWLRLVVSHFPQDSDRTIVVQNAFSLRSALEKDLLPKGSKYMSNCVGFINVVLSAKDVLQKPLGYVALQIRHAIVEQGTREQVEAYAALVRKSNVGAPPFFGDGSNHLVSFSNWTKGKLFEVDMSAAAVKPRDTPCTPCYIQSVEQPYSFTEGFQIVGKDSRGNYWLCGNRVKGNWGKVEAMLKGAGI